MDGRGLLFTDPAGRVLLVEPTYKEHWEIPGGCVEADESLRRVRAARHALSHGGTGYLEDGRPTA
ncbi:NUDIX domain-containing protein [Plantactinospora sp. KLBMP9567]|uniref:NUDIX domain-containing protein n=1 Tax=Plantactinospora sp. KLBMP9567 TaxID=3085900 RepID=UPI003990B56D